MKKTLIPLLILFFALIGYTFYRGVPINKKANTIFPTTTVATVVEKTTNSNVKIYTNKYHNFSFAYHNNFSLVEWIDKINDAGIKNEHQILISDPATAEALSDVNTAPLFMDKINIFINEETKESNKDFEAITKSNGWTKANYNGFDIWEKETNMFDVYKDQQIIKLDTKEDQMRAEMLKSQKMWSAYFKYEGDIYFVQSMMATEDEMQTVLSTWVFAK